MSKRHKVKTHSWSNGILNTVEHFFDSLEEALAHSVSQTQTHSNSSDSHIVKIYDENEEIVHHTTTHPVPVTNSYA